MRRGFKKWCEDQAALHRQYLGLLAHERLPARSLAHYLKIDLISPEEIPDINPEVVNHLVNGDPRSWSAVTVSVGHCCIIVYNPSNSRRRHEADVMHELAHVIIGHKPIRVGSVPWFPIPVREYNEADEEEANWLGGCLQIPRVGLEWAFRNKITGNTEIADLYCASLDMVQFRRNMTGIDRQYRQPR